MKPNQKLFLNVHPRTLVDSRFSSGETLKCLECYGLAPENVVFEITERHSVKDFGLFHNTLEYYRRQGYKVAVDDVGTGYSGLWTIAELRPDYIKIDMSFIRGIDTNPVKRALLETFVTFAGKIGSKIIAEGIETATEFSCLVSIGVELGQGYYLARPAHKKPTEQDLPATLRGRSSLKIADKCSIPVKNFVSKCLQIAKGTKVREVKTLLGRDEAIHSVAVVEKNRPVGLIMSHHLDRALSMQYGMSLYYNRPVENIMDAHPLIVEADTALEHVARLSMGRDKIKIYDNILVTEQGRLLGYVSVQSILDALASVQVEMAKGANPLSGLPGNVVIEKEMETRCGQAIPFCTVYADLDNFKAYNDAYGFKCGDEMLLLLSRILNWGVKKYGNGESFLGHVGGDDFIFMTSTDRAERICKAIVRCFKRLVPYRYSQEDRDSGLTRSRDRNGKLREFPLVSVSLAIVECQPPCPPDAISLRAAEMKKVAKELPGNVYAKDRRQPVGS